MHGNPVMVIVFTNGYTRPCPPLSLSDLTLISCSHLNSEKTGAIHEGVSSANLYRYLRRCDEPDLIVCCIVGDAKAGRTATAWHGAKYIGTAEPGAVIPIIHVNGFNISDRTIFGCMDDKGDRFTHRLWLSATVCLRLSSDIEHGPRQPMDWE